MNNIDPDRPLDLAGAFGAAPNYLPDEQSPRVDKVILERLIRRELPPEESMLAFRLVNMFRPWRHAFTEVVEAKLAGMTDQDWTKAGISESPWLSAGLSWPQGQSASVVGLVLALALSVSKQLRLSIPGKTRSDPTNDPDLADQDLENALSAGSPLDFRDQDRWLHWVPTNEGVDIRAGLSPADSFPGFTVEFREKDMPIAKHQSHAGVVHLTVNDSLALIQGKADEIRITVPS